MRHHGKVIPLSLQEGHSGFFEVIRSIDIIAIGVNESLTQPEKVKTIIHEFVHLGIEREHIFGDYNSNPFNNMDKNDFTRYEENVESLTQDIYNCQPRFVEHIMQRFLRKD